jgi:hypothetical protein
VGASATPSRRPRRGGGPNRALEGQQLVLVVDIEAVDADRPEAGAGFLLGLLAAGAQHRVLDEVRDADAGAAGSEDDDPVVVEVDARDVDGREDGGEHDRRGALDVVVEGAESSR